MVPLGGKLLKIYDAKLGVMHGGKYNVSLFLNGVSHTEIYNTFGHGIYHKNHYICKSKSHVFHHSNIGIFSGNDTIMAGYLWLFAETCSQKKYFKIQ